MSTTTENIISAGIAAGTRLASALPAAEHVQALREMIAAALEEARREGAEAMRRECECFVRPYMPRELYGDHHAQHDIADAIRALPLLTGERQAVLLTCDQCGAECTDPWHYSDGDRRHLHACDACGVPERRAVLLTDEELLLASGRVTPLTFVAERTYRAIESAVLSANNLEVRRG